MRGRLGGGAGGDRIVDDHADVGAGGVQREDLIHLGRREADGVRNVANAMAEEIARLVEGGNGDAAEVGRKRQARHVD